ncbi:hypothetical protein [Peribacillus frigoritolerans]|uniref:hypothetical protein n=1 Tax=Peribacillus frigoritolerans TaxID=450367 RepID=UPI00343A7FDB
MKKFKKLILAAAVVILAIVGVSTPASAALGSTAVKMDSSFAYGGTAYIHTSQDGSNIYSTYEAAYDSYVYVKLSVQVYESGTWRTVETKSGYARKAWGENQKFNATFYNYSTAGTRTFRIRASIYDWYDTSYLMQTAYSATWTR